MERIGKYEKFPVLEAGDVVVCGKHTAYLVTGKGGYKLRESSDPAEFAALAGYFDDLNRLFGDFDNRALPRLSPEVIFRPREGYTFESHLIKAAMKDWRSVSIDNTERFSRIWSIDDDNVKELTVDEVSELLGYKVKIVGSGIAD